MSQLFSLPPTFTDNLESRLLTLSHSLHEPEKLAGSIRLLSNLFLKGIKKEEYWKSSDFRAAYLAYFAVLNFVRCQAVFSEARARHFLENAKVVADWGCGAGSATWALVHQWTGPSLPQLIGADQSSFALDEFQNWMGPFNFKAKVEELPTGKLGSVEADTLIFSYVLNELESYPVIPPYVERLIVIEPSTHQAGRTLLQWRDEMLAKGWHAWAPCTHQEKCPLLSQSGKDWCHHRVHWQKPEWFLQLEKFLPMHNNTLTLSYVLLAKDPPPRYLKGLARVVGDEQEERGKTRQMICQGPQREFLSWLHRDQISLKLKRGDLIHLQNPQPKGNELRVVFAKDVEKYEG